MSDKTKPVRKTSKEVLAAEMANNPYKLDEKKILQSPLLAGYKPSKSSDQITRALDDSYAVVAIAASHQRKTIPSSRPLPFRTVLQNKNAANNVVENRTSGFQINIISGTGSVV
jgi:hypothetical protein